MDVGECKEAPRRADACAPIANIQSKAAEATGNRKEHSPMRKLISLSASSNRSVATIPTIIASTSDSARSTETLAHVEGFEL